MAERVDPSELIRPALGPRPKYPWAEWTDGEWWHAKQGEDFTVSPSSFRSTLSNHAVKRGLKVTTHQTEEGITFQFTVKESGT